MPGPLAAILAPAAINAGASIISGLLNKPSGAEKALTGEMARKLQLEGNILGMREEFLETMLGERDAFRKAIVDKKGQPIVMRLPGVGGVSDEQWAKNLNQAIGAIDFGGKRAWDAGLQLLSQLNPGSNSAGAGAGMAGQMTSQRQQSTGATAGFLSDLGTSLFDHFTADKAPGGGGIGNIVSAGIPELPIGDILPQIPANPLPMPIPAAPIGVPLSVGPQGPVMEGGF